MQRIIEALDTVDQAIRQKITLNTPVSERESLKKARNLIQEALTELLLHRFVRV